MGRSPHQVVLLAGAVAVAAAGSAAGAQEPAPPLPACDPAGARALTLVAPATLPIGYPGGFYLEKAGPGYPDGPSLNSQRALKITVTMADGRSVALDRDRDRDRDDRWPLRFAPGDGAAHISVTYTESTRQSGLDCIRELTADVQPTAVEDAQVRLSRPRVRSRRVTTRDGITYLAVTVKVRGRVAPVAAHPVRIDVSHGALRRMHTAHVRNGRVSATIRLLANAGQGPRKAIVRAVYPGDVDETWPCDDVFTTGPHDTCTTRLRAPQGVPRT